MGALAVQKLRCGLGGVGEDAHINVLWNLLCGTLSWELETEKWRVGGDQKGGKTVLRAPHEVGVVGGDLPGRASWRRGLLSFIKKRPSGGVNERQRGLGWV